MAMTAPEHTWSVRYPCIFCARRYLPLTRIAAKAKSIDEPPRRCLARPARAGRALEDHHASVRLRTLPYTGYLSRPPKPSKTKRV